MKAFIKKIDWGQVIWFVVTAPIALLLADVLMKGQLSWMTILMTAE